MEWYKKLGFHSNPFSIKPAAFNNELIAYDMGYIHKKIDEGEVLFVEGRYGTGKTTILKNIINEFRGRNKIIYFSFNAGKKFDAEKLLDGANSLMRRIAGMQVRNVIFLLDEVHTMTKTDANELLKHYKEGSIKSLVFVTHDANLVSFPEELDTVLNGNVIKTINLSQPEAVDLVRRRIGNISLLSDNMIKTLFRLSENNPRRLLEYCEDVCKYAVELGDDTVTDFHVEEVIGIKVKKVAPKKPAVKKKAVEKKVEKKVEEEKKPEEEVKVASKATPKPKKATKKKVAPKPVIKEEPKKVVDDMGWIEVKELKEKVESEKRADAEPRIEIKEMDEPKKQKKYKVNKLVDKSQKSTLGQIEETESEPMIQKQEENSKEGVSEYQVYFFDEEE